MCDGVFAASAGLRLRAGVRKGDGAASPVIVQTSFYLLIGGSDQLIGA